MEAHEPAILRWSEGNFVLAVCLGLHGRLERQYQAEQSDYSLYLSVMKCLIVDSVGELCQQLLKAVILDSKPCILASRPFIIACLLAEYRLEG